MNRVLLTLTGLLMAVVLLRAGNPTGDLRIEMLEYHNLVVDHNIQTPAGASPRAVYIGVRFCNDGTNPLTDVFANIGDFTLGQPGVYPINHVTSGPYTGDFSFHHEGSQKDAVRYIGTLAPGQCVTQYWLLSYPLLDAAGNRVCGSKPDQTDDLKLRYDVWASAKDGGTTLEANTSKTLQLRAEISAMANKIWPNTTSKVPNEFLAAFPDKQLGWRQTTPTSASHPGANVVLEGVWFDLGNIRKGFDNDGDYVPDYNFLLQPVGDPGVYDANCFRLVKVSGLIVIKLHGGATQTIDFTDQMHFKGIPEDNTGAVGMVFYEFAVLNGPCASALTPYQEVASGSDNEKHNGDYGTPAGTLVSTGTTTTVNVTVPSSTTAGTQTTVTTTVVNPGTRSIGNPTGGAPLVINNTVPVGTTYVAGSAASSNTFPVGVGVTILYSSNNGSSWETSEPPANTVTDVSYVLNNPLPASATAVVKITVDVPSTFSAVQYCGEASVGLGFSDPFIAGQSCSFVPGINSLSGIVWQDNGGSTGIAGNGIKDGNELVFTSIPVKLAYDANNNGIQDANERVLDTKFSNPSGTFSFTSVPDGNFLLVADKSVVTSNPSYTGWGPTTILTQKVDIDANNGNSGSTSITSGHDFGFAPPLDIVKTQLTPNPTTESSRVEYNITVKNQLLSTNASSEPCTFWTTAVQSGTDWSPSPAYAVGANGPDGNFARYSKNGNGINQPLYTNAITGSCPGTITKVEIVNYIYTKNNLANDSFSVQAIIPGVGTYITKYFGGDLGAYNGIDNAHELVTDITSKKASWSWSDIQNMSLVIKGEQNGFNIWVDAMGIRVTTGAATNPNGFSYGYDESTTLSSVPMVETYDPAKFQFVSASVSPDAVNTTTGTLTWNNVGPLNAGESDTIKLTFLAKDFTGTTPATVNFSTSITEGKYANSSDANDDSATMPTTVNPRGTISGKVFGDKNSNGWSGTLGYESATDFFMENVVVNLYGCTINGTTFYPPPAPTRTCTHVQNGGTWTLLQRDTSNLTGDYAFNGLSNGLYYILVDVASIPGTETLKADPDKTSGICTTCDHMWKSSTLAASALGTIGISNDLINVNFGYAVSPAISGIVFEDINANGLQDALDKPISNVTVERVATGCTAGVNCPTSITNAMGKYEFAALTAATAYTIKVRTTTLPATYTWTETFESDGTINNAIARTLAAGVQSTDNDFGWKRGGNSDLGGYVYQDVTGNASGVNPSAVFSAVTVRLYEDKNNNGVLDNSTDVPKATTTTNASGYFQFSNNAAANYLVVIDQKYLPTGTEPSVDPDETGICITCDGMAKVTGLNGTTDIYNLNFGFEEVGDGRVEGNVYLDDNGNTIFNEFESGLPFVEVILQVNLNGSGNYAQVETVKSAGDGSYYFENLPDGEYRVVANTSDASIPTGYYASTDVLKVFTLGTGPTPNTGGADFGFTPSGNIESYVFYDGNGNGTQDWNEEGVPGVTVYLCNASAAICNATAAIATDVTDTEGKYSFNTLTSGDYTVSINTGTLPSGVTATSLTADPSTDGVPCYSPLDPADPNYSILLAECNSRVNSLSVEVGSLVGNANFGYQPTGIIGDIIYRDLNQNGVQDDNEPGIPNITVKATNKTTVVRGGVTYPPGAFVRSVPTDFDGQYIFINMPDATWNVQILPPTDMTSTVDADGVADNRVDVVVSGGDVTAVGNVWCPSGIDCSLDVTFGLRPTYPNSVSGKVCLDDDNNGVCDVTDLAPTAVKVFAYDKQGRQLAQTVANAAGQFTFNYLPNDTITISVSTEQTPLTLTTTTTSVGDSPAYAFGETDNSTYQQFILTGNVTGVNFAFAFTDTFDLGDLPVPYLSDVNVTSTGPVHLLEDVPTLYLGATVDAEFFSATGADANGDDSVGGDEDGVTFGDPNNWTVGTAASGNGGDVTVNVTGTGHLIAWIDFSQDGDFNDPVEMIVERPVTTGSFNIEFDIPTGTDLSGGQEIYSRFRVVRDRPFSPATAYSGLEIGGEVEDYRVNICHNLASPGTILGAETGCDGFDPIAITEATTPLGGGGDLIYQWQESTDGGLTWADILGANAVTYDPVALTETIRYRRGAVREYCSAMVYSNAIAKTVLTNFVDGGIIGGDEDNCGVYDPGIISSVVAPSGGTGTGTVYYQWQQSTDGGASWADIVAATQEFFDPGIISQTTQYRRAARKAPCTIEVYSNPITKMVAINFVSAGTITGAESFCGSYDPGIITNLALPTGGIDGYIGYQWERSIDGGNTWVVIPGAIGIDYNPGNITQTTQYRRKARRVPCGVWVNTNVIIKEVKDIPVANINTAPATASGFLCEETGYSFGAASAGAGVTYTWDFGSYASTPSMTGQGPFNVEFDVPNGAAFTTINVGLTVDKNGCTVATSKIVNVRPEIIINSVNTVDPDACSAVNGNMAIIATYPPAATVQYSINGGATWSNSNFFNYLGAGVYDVQVRYVGGDCSEDFGYISLSDPPPAATMLLSSTEECVGQTITVEATSAAIAPNYTWFFGAGATPGTATGAGPHNVKFSTGGANSIAVRIEVGGCIGVTDTILTIVENFNNGGSVLGGGTLCGTFNPVNIAGGSYPSGGFGSTALFQWEQRQRTSPTTWGAWSDIAGANGVSFDPSTISVTTEYRRKARRSACTGWVYSNSVSSVLVKQPNLADDLYFTVCPGFPYANNVSGNDLNLSNPAFGLLTNPTNGWLDLDSDGEILFVPNTTYCGFDKFRYFVCNENSVCCDSANVTFDLTDIQPPSLANVPDNISISCDDQMPLAEAVQVIENCQNVSLGIDQFITQGSDSCALYNYDFVRVWNGVDYCVNTAQASQTISISDQTAPDIYRIYTLPNGKRLVAGVMENVSEHWKTVALPVNFATQPIVFTQITTRNEAAAAVVRLRNVSTTQFQMSLKEEEAADGRHNRENVAWVAIEKGAFSGSMKFEVNSWLLTHANSAKSFSQGYPSAPEFIASIQTNNESDPVNVRISNKTSSGLNIRLQEETSADAETGHNLETVGYMAITGAYDLKANTSEVFGEVGKVDLTHLTTTVNLHNKYHNPVVIMGAITNNDAAPVTVRVINVTANSFTVKLDEYDYLNGLHATETLSYFVIEGSLPLDSYISCDNIPVPLTIGTQVIAKDNCDQTVKLRMSEDKPNFDCSTDTVLTRTYYVVDDCGNATELKHTMILRDLKAPTFTVPANITILCGTNKDNLAITGDVTDAADNCAADVAAIYVDNQSNLLGCNGYILRTWSAEDECGNITSKVQTITIAPPTDTDADGVADFYDLDDDNDGIPDLKDGLIDADGDGIPNNHDLDSDNDGISDLIETGKADFDGDGVIDIIGTSGWDHDGDGFAYGFDGNDISITEAASATFNPGSVTNDRDQDGVPNFLDRDSDNDGITDLVEIVGADVDGNGILDYPVLSNPLTMPDLDADGFHDRIDSNDDGAAGAEDSNEPFVKFNGYAYTGGLATDKPDYDGDGIPNFLDRDSDNDGTPDLIEAGGVDNDGDGRLRFTGYFVDTNSDGYFDIYAANPLVLTKAGAASGNLRPYDYGETGTTFVSSDMDSDGRPNHLDRDSDGDRIFDIFEAGLKARDANSDGAIDNLTDANFSGFDDVVEVSGNTVTEPDGFTFDGRPEDSGDFDATPYLSTQVDGNFAAANGLPDVDDDGDGKLNMFDVDSDNDLLTDNLEDRNFNGIVDGGETNSYNTDTDGDGIFDGVEDRNQDGIRNAGETDPLNPNSDGDLLTDGDEDDNKDGVLDAGESSPINPCDPYLSAACKGVAIDVKIKLMGALVGNQDPLNIMSDELRTKLVLPTTEPYTKLTHINHIGVPVNPNSEPGTGTNGNTGTGGGSNTGSTEYKEWFTPGLLYVTGYDAPIDWILVELRPASFPDSVVATRAAILQADGDIRDVDGFDYLQFSEVTSGDYFVSVRHRNHLGVMSEDPYLLSPTVTTIDFKDNDTPMYGNESRISHNGEMAMWPGDFNNDGRVIYQGPSNDVTYLFQTVLLNQGNTEELANFIVQGYKQADLNLDGNSIYQGPNNDRAMMLLNAILTTPENDLHLANFILQEKLP